MSKEESKQKEIYTYDAPWPVYSINWSVRSDPRHKYRLAFGSFLEDYENQIKIIQLDEERGEYVERSSFIHQYPPTKLMWIPDKQSQKPDILATSGDCLRIWKVADDNSVSSIAKLKNSSNTEFSSPLTSFDWNDYDLNMIGTSSIDTTCTIWDLETQKVKTQLIAHDNEVYDFVFANGKDVFCTVGADGSVRMFDLRNLEHSTILYENPNPILRIAWNKQDAFYIATVLQDSNKSVILDVRVPSRPVIELVGHTSSVNCLSWAPHSACHICTAGDDSKALIWNLSRIVTPMDPILAYNAGYEIDALQWSTCHPDWISIAFNRKIQMLRV